ncbi:unnamed protein product, partial [Discosporangium mesarthrocarpum]
MAVTVVTVDGSRYDSKADIWSLGITALELVNGHPPFANLHPMRAVLLIPKSPPPQLSKDRSYSKRFHNFLEQCLQPDPRNRPSALDLLKHPFIRSARR